MKKVTLLTFTVLIVPILLLSGCAPSVPTRLKITQELPPLSQDMSRMYVFNGTYYSTWEMDLNKYGGAGNVFINNSQVGFINETEYIALDIQPGDYELHWQPIMAEIDMKYRTSKKTSLSLLPGETYYIAANMRDSGSKAAWAGLVGILATSDYLYVDTLDEAPLSATSTRLVDYKVLTSDNISNAQN